MTGNTDQNNQRFVEESQTDLLHFVEKRLHNREDAQAVVQDAYLKFFRAGYAADSKDARPLLFTIAKNLLNDHYRQQQKQNSLISAETNENLDQNPGREKDPSETLDSSRQLNKIITLIENMPPKRQEVFKLSRFEGLKNREIAEHLNISQSMVEKHLAAALQDLRTTLT